MLAAENLFSYRDNLKKPEPKTERSDDEATREAREKRENVKGECQKLQEQNSGTGEKPNAQKPRNQIDRIRPKKKSKCIKIYLTEICEKYKQCFRRSYTRSEQGDTTPPQSK